MHQLLQNYTNAPSYVGSLRYSLAKNKLEAFLVKWLSANRDLAQSLLKKAKEGTLKPTDYPNPLFSHHRAPLYSNPSLNNSSLNLNTTLTPPRAPHEAIQRSTKKFSETVANNQMLARSVFVGKSNRPLTQSEVVPPFFMNGGRPVDGLAQTNYKSSINNAFGTKGQINHDDCKNLVSELMGLPTYFSVLIYEKLGKTLKDKINKTQFTNMWKSQWENKDSQKRAFYLLKKPNRDFIVADDFKPLLKEILNCHPGLEFLKDTPQFQDWYSLCVINRIMYRADRKLNGKISFREYRKAKITQSLFDIESQNDINKNRDFFSYEDFYVIYIKFWELDSDHDFYLTKQQFSKYSGYALSRKAVERIFSQGARKFQQDKDKMNFGDFVWFILSQEDKTTETSIQFWFKIVDLDSNGIITGYELQHFFQEQSQRLAFLNNQLVINFQNIVCQMVDLLKPEVGIQFTLDQFLKQKNECGIFFNMLMNLNKLVDYEQRDAYAIRANKEEHPDYTEWQRFVKPEYKKIESQADNDDGGQVLGMDGWEAD